MTQPAAEREIRVLIEGWAEAVRRHDLQGILAHHLHDIVMFDLPPPLQMKGLEDYRKSWDLFFKYHKPAQAFRYRGDHDHCGRGCRLRLSDHALRREPDARRVLVPVEHRAAQDRRLLAHRA